MKWIWIFIKTIFLAILVEVIWLLFLEEIIIPTNSHNIKSFKASKTSYSINESIKFNIKLNQASYLYLLTLSDNKACIFFTPKTKPYPEGEQNNLFDLEATQKENDQFYLLGSKEPLSFLEFKDYGSLRCVERNEGIKIKEALEQEGVESFRVDVSIE